MRLSRTGKCLRLALMERAGFLIVKRLLDGLNRLRDVAFRLRRPGWFRIFWYPRWFSRWQRRIDAKRRLG